MERMRGRWQNPYVAAIERFESAYFQATMNLAHAQELVESAAASLRAAREAQKAAATTEKRLRAMAPEAPPALRQAQGERRPDSSGVSGSVNTPG